MRRILTLLAVLAILLSRGTQHASAANRTWDGGGANNNWGTANNWNPNTAPAGGDLLFFAGTNRLGAVNSFAANTAFNGLTFSNNAGAFILTGNAINLGGGITNNSTSLQTINLNLALTATRNIDVVSAGSLTIGGVISGGFGITKSGAGTLTLAGGSANTYSGATTVNDGTLQLNKTAGNAYAGTLTIGDGSGAASSAVTRWLAANQAPANAITVNSDGLMNLNNFSDAVGALTLAGGSITTGTGTLTLGGNITGNADANTATISGNLALGGNRTFTIADGAAATDMQISAVVSGAFTLTKAGAGTLTLSGANTYSGITTINSGVLRLNSAGALGGGNLTLNGGVLGLGAGDFTRTLGTGAGQVQWTGDGGFAAYGANRNVNLNGGAALVWTTTANFLQTADVFILGAADADATVTFQNNLSLGDNGFTTDRTIQVNDGSAAIDAVLSGVVSTTDNTRTFIKTGAGTLALINNNTYVYPTDITAGAINIQNANALGSTIGNTTVSGGAALQIQGGITTAAEALILNGTGVSADGALRNISGNNTYAGAITLGSATRINSDSGTLTLNSGTAISGATFGLAVGGAGNVTISSVIGTTSGTVTKDGAGTLTLSGANTFGGVLTVSAGTVSIGTINNVSANGVLGNSANAVVLGGSGTTGTLRYTGSTAASTKGFTLATGGGGAFDVTTSGTALTLSGVIGGSGTLTKSGAGTLVLGGANTYSGDTTISAGTLRLGANNVIANGASGGNVSVSSGAIFDMAGFSEIVNGLSGDGVVDNSGGAVTFQVGDNNQSSIFGGTIQDSGSALSVTKIGTGTLTLNGNNTYDGLTTISGGIIRLGSATALGTTTVGTTVGSGAALDLNGQSVGAESVTLNGTGVSSGGALFNSSGAASLSGAITLATSTSFGGSGNLTLSGVISGSGNSLTKVGSGTAILSGNNTFTGGLNVNAGVLAVGGAGALNSANPNAVAISSGATLRLNGNSVTVSGLTGAGTVQNNHATTAATLTVNKASGSDIFSGLIQNGAAAALAINKTGNGTLVLSGANTYTGGTTLSDGEITLGANNALGSGGLAFAGGILNANNRTVSMGALSLTADSTLNLLDDGTTSSLTFSSATWTGGILTINGWSGIEQIGSDDDAIIVSATPNQDFLSHVLFQLDSGLYFAEMSGNELVPSLTPVPEPTEWALIIFATLAVLYKFVWPRLRGSLARG